MFTTRCSQFVFATIAVVSLALPACSFSYSGSSGSAAPTSGGKPINKSSSKPTGKSTGKTITPPASSSSPSSSSSSPIPKGSNQPDNDEDDAPIPKGESKPASTPKSSTTLSVKPDGATDPAPEPAEGPADLTDRSSKPKSPAAKKVVITK